MKFPSYVASLAGAIHRQDGTEIESLLRYQGSLATQLARDMYDSSRRALLGFKGSITSPWDEIAIAHVQVVVHSANKNFAEAYKEQAVLAQAFLRYFITSTSWTLPILFSICKDLRDLALQADQTAFEDGATKLPGCMEDAARVINKAFSSCLTDRQNPLLLSRKWGLYYIVGLTLKCYFRINKTSLSTSILRAIQANREIPPLAQYPKAHQITYRYYIGMLAFLGERLKEAEEEFVFVFNNCPTWAERNQELALTYLIPLRLIRGQLPSARLLDRFENLQLLYTPFVDALRKGDVGAFDRALAWAEPRLVDMNVYLTVEKAREICLRGLFRRAWLILRKPTRMPISSFHSALIACGLDVPVEEAECLVATLIYRKYILGYISHERQMVVLSVNAFPSLKILFV